MQSLRLIAVQPFHHNQHLKSTNGCEEILNIKTRTCPMEIVSFTKRGYIEFQPIFFNRIINSPRHPTVFNCLYGDLMGSPCDRLVLIKITRSKKISTQGASLASSQCRRVKITFFLRGISFHGGQSASKAHLVKSDFHRKL